jgi:hypothetical protein
VFAAKPEKRPFEGKVANFCLRPIAGSAGPALTTCACPAGCNEPVVLSSSLHGGSNGASNHLYPNPVYVRLVPEGSNGEPMLLDKNGTEISSVAAYNAKDADDVLRGLEKQGLYAKGQAGHQVGIR